MEAYSACAHVVDERRRGRSTPRLAVGRRRTPAAAASRWSAWPDSERAKTASAMPVTGTPRSSALCTVQRPVPFCSAWSARRRRTACRSRRRCGASTSAVISIRNESRSPRVPLAEDRPRSRAGRGRRARAAAGRTPRRSAACRRTRCRCAPSSRSARRRPAPTWVQHGVPSTCAAIDSSIGPSDSYGLGRAAGHDARPVQRALLAAGDAGADEVQALLAQRLLAAAGVGEVRVAAVDDDVARLEQRRRARRSPRRWPSPAFTMMMTARGRSSDGDEVLERLGRRRSRPRRRTPRPGSVRPRGGPVVHRDRVAVPGEVAGQVAAHHRQAGHADARGGGPASRPGSAKSRSWRPPFHRGQAGADGTR